VLSSFIIKSVRLRFFVHIFKPAGLSCAAAMDRWEKQRPPLDPGLELSSFGRLAGLLPPFLFCLILQRYFVTRDNEAVDLLRLFRVSI